jgi:hypothetical protein
MGGRQSTECPFSLLREAIGFNHRDRNWGSSATFSARRAIMALEIVFLGALVLLTGLIFAILNWHYRDRRKGKITEQIVRDRYEHDRT